MIGIFRPVIVGATPSQGSGYPGEAGAGRLREGRGAFVTQQMAEQITRFAVDMRRQSTRAFSAFDRIAFPVTITAAILCTCWTFLDTDAVGNQYLFQTVTLLPALLAWTPQVTIPVSACTGIGIDPLVNRFDADTHFTITRKQHLELRRDDLRRPFLTQPFQYLCDKRCMIAALGMAWRGF